MKRFFSIVMICGLLLSLMACGSGEVQSASAQEVPEGMNPSVSQEAVRSADVSELYPDAVYVEVSDDGVTVDGEAASEEAAAVYVAHDIIYYEEGRDFTYGEGTESDEHSEEEAAEHTVVHITAPGTYVLSGTMTAGQIAVDLGEDAEDDPEAVVTLVLNGLDMTCTVAPGVIFYNVYECSEADEETASKEVDTSGAGANVVIPDGTVSRVQGSYVARIYKSVELSEDGTEVVDSKKLHKYDGAFYSKMSMNIYGGEENSGVLQILAENEGLDSELHLTVNGGQIYITSGNDGINTNEDNVSVTTVNDGLVWILCDGSTGEGDGIDSNGRLVINGGQVYAQGCATSGDAGIDSDLGIHINGGTVMASGNMLDRISESAATYAVLQMNEKLSSGDVLTLRDESGEPVIVYAPTNSCSYVVLSAETLTAGDYTLWVNDVQYGHGGTMEFGGDWKPDGMERPEGVEHPENMVPPDGVELPEEGGMPKGMNPPEGENMAPPDGMGGGRGQGGKQTAAASEAVFTLTEGGNTFHGVGMIKE